MSKRSSAGEDTGVETIKEELVRFDNVKSSYYTGASRVTLTYTLLPNTTFTLQDWIGLFPVPIHSTSDPLAHTLAAPKCKSKKRKKRGNNEDRRQVDFPLGDASDNIVTDSKHHRYQFVYVSKGGKIYGESRAFAIQGEELWNLEDDDEEFSRLSTPLSEPDTLLHDSEISILSRSQANTCQSESPVLLSYPSDMESEGGDVTNHEDWDIPTSPTNEHKSGTEKKVVSETALSEFSDIEILSRSPSKDDYSSAFSSCGGSPVKVHPEDDFTLCDIKIQGSHFGVLEDRTTETDDEGKDESESSFAKKSKKKKGKRKAQNTDKMTTSTYVSDNVKDSEKLEDTDDVSRRETVVNGVKSSRKEKKKTEAEKAKIEDLSVPEVNADSACEKPRKDVSGKLMKKLLKSGSNKDESCDKPEEKENLCKDCSDNDVKVKSKKSKKDKRCGEKGEVVPIERIRTPPLSHKTISQTVTEQLKFLDVEDDVKSIKLSDVEGGDDEEDEEGVGKALAMPAMSRKEKRKLRKMKERNEIWSSSHKALIVELGAVEESENLVNKDEAQAEDRVTDDSPKVRDVCTGKESGRVKKSKKKNSDRRECDTESTTDTSKETDTSAAATVSHDKSTSPVTSANSDNENIAQDNDKSIAETKNAKSKRDNGKKVTKDKKNSMSIYFETAAAPVDVKVTNLETKSNKRTKGADCGNKLDQSDIVTDADQQQPKPGKKSKRVVKEDENIACKSRSDHEEVEDKLIVEVENNTTRGRDVSKGTQIENVTSEQTGKRTKKSKRSIVENDEGERTDALLVEDKKSNGVISSTISDAPGTEQDGQDEKEIIKSSKKLKRAKKSETEEKVNTETMGDSKSMWKSKDKNRKIPKSATASGQHQSEGVDGVDDDLVREAERHEASCSKKASRKVPKELKKSGQENRGTSHTDILNNNVTENGDCSVSCSKQIDDEGKKKRRKNKTETQEKQNSCDVEETLQEVIEIRDKKSKSKKEEKAAKELQELQQKASAEETENNTKVPNIQNPFSGCGTNKLGKDQDLKEVKRKSKKPSSSDTVEEGSKVKVETVGAVQTNLHAAEDENINLKQDTKQVGHILKEEKMGREPKKVVDKEGLHKIKKVCSVSSGGSCWSDEWDGNEKENAKMSVRNKLYLTKKEKMRAAIKAKFNKKERRAKVKSGKVIRLKELFEDSLAPSTPVVEKLTVSESPDSAEGGTGPDTKKESIISRLCSSTTPVSTVAIRGIKRPHIPAYLLDVMDDLPHDLDTPDFLEWRKSMAHGKGKGQGQGRQSDSSDDPQTHGHGDVTVKTSGKQRGSREKGRRCYTVSKERKTTANVTGASILPQSPLAVVMTKRSGAGIMDEDVYERDDYDDEDDEDDEDDDDGDDEVAVVKEVGPRKNSGGGAAMSLMSYANVLKGLAVCMHKAREDENAKKSLVPSTSSRMATKSHSRGRKQLQQLQADDKKTMVRARRAIFSSGLKHLAAAAMETQCYLLDKVEDRQMGKHPQYSRRTKVRAAWKTKMDKQRRKKLIQARLQNRTRKEVLNGQMLSTALIPMCTSFACDPAGSFSLTVNDSSESLDSVMWPLPHDFKITAAAARDLSTVAALVEDKRSCSTWSSVCGNNNGTDATHQGGGGSSCGNPWMTTITTTMNGDDECVGLTSHEAICFTSGTEDEENDILRRIESWRPPPTGSTRSSPEDNQWTHSRLKAATVRGGAVRLPGYPKSLGLAHIMLQRLRSQVKGTDREMASLENQVNCLKEVIKAQSKQEFKTRFKLFAVKRKYNALKAARRGQQQSESVLQPEMPRSIDEVFLAERTRDEDDIKGSSQYPPCKKMKFEDEILTQGQQQVTEQLLFAPVTPKTEDESFPLDLRTDGSERKATVDASRLYPDIQKELSNLQKEVNKYSEKPKAQPHQSQWQQCQPDPTAPKQQASFVFPSPVSLMPTCSTGAWQRDSRLPTNSYHFSSKYSEKYPKLEHRPYQIPNLNQMQDVSQITPMTPLDFLPQQQYQHQPHHHQQQQKQPQIATGTKYLFAPPPQPQLIPTPQFNFPTHPVQPATLVRNDPDLKSQYSPPKPALLPTPTQAHLTASHPDTCPPIPANNSQMPQPNAQPSTDSVYRSSPRGYSCPPHQRSASPLVFYHQTSPTWRRRQSQSTVRPNAFGNHRYTPMTRNPQPATVMVAPRPRYFNRPFPCNAYSQSPYLNNNMPVYGRPQREPYSQCPVESYPIRDEYNVSEKFQSCPFNTHGYFIPEHVSGIHQPCCFNQSEEETIPDNSLSHSSNCPHFDSCCPPPRHDMNCCHNYSFMYTH